MVSVRAGGRAAAETASSCGLLQQGERIMAGASLQPDPMGRIPVHVGKVGPARSGTGFAPFAPARPKPRSNLPILKSDPKIMGVAGNFAPSTLDPCFGAS